MILHRFYQYRFLGVTIVAIGIFLFGMKVGTRFHELFFQNQTSLLSVVGQSGTERIALEMLESCSQENRPIAMNKETCYSKKFRELALQNGPEKSFEILSLLQQKDPEAQGCHFIAHGIGSGTYRRDPKAWQSHIKSISHSCTYGALHGIIEEYVARLPDKTLSKDIVPTICGSEPRADCNHIIGHLVLVETKGNIDNALDICRIFQDKHQRNFCLTGVFMEHSTASNLIAHGYATEEFLNWPARVGDLEKLCRSYDGEEAAACWEEIVHAALVKFNNDPERIFSFCNTAQTNDAAKRCKRHAIGIMIVARGFDFGSLRYMCKIKQSNDPSFENECYAYLAGSVLFTVPRQAKNIAIFCNSLDDNLKVDCFTQIGAMFKEGLMTSGEGTDPIEVCNIAPIDLRGRCRGDNIEVDTFLPRTD